MELGEDGAGREEGSIGGTVQVQPQGEAGEPAVLRGRHQQQMAGAGLVERGRGELRAGRAVRGGGVPPGVHAGSGDAMALARLVQGC